MSRRSRGFTLIEVSVTMLIIALLAAAAIASYSSYMVRGRRAAAKQVLVQAAQYLERQYTASGCYNATTPAGCAAATAATVPPLPQQLTYAPSEGTATYAVSFAAGADYRTGFTLVATPCKDAGSTCNVAGVTYMTTYADAECDKFQLDNTGAKSLAGSYTGTPTSCWQR